MQPLPLFWLSQASWETDKYHHQDQAIPLKVMRRIISEGTHHHEPALAGYLLLQALFLLSRARNFEPASG